MIGRKVIKTFWPITEFQSKAEDIRMSDKAAVERTLDQFFQSIRDCDMSTLPLADQASYSGTMLPEPARGAAAVRQHMADTAPFIQSFSIEETVIENQAAAVLVRYEAINGVQFEGCYFLEVENGLITRIRTVFDSRPLMTGG
jgi:hypothetical protein